MARPRHFPFLRLAIVALAVLSLAASVEVDYDDTADFSAYRSYAWQTGTPARRPSAERHIVATVDRELGARGLVREDAQPDLWVVTHVLIDRQSLERLSDERYFAFVAAIRDVDAYDVGGGTLVVDLVDRTTETVVWRAVGSEAVKGPEKKMLKKVDRLIGEMFRKYPAGSP